MNLDCLGSAQRSVRLRSLRSLEEGLRTDGWVSVVPPCARETGRLYHEAHQLFADKEVCARLRRDVLCATQGLPLGLTFLGDGDEPLYDADASQQHVCSLNMHEHLEPLELDARTADYDVEERELARRYHAWDVADLAILPLRHAASALRSQLVTSANGVPQIPDLRISVPNAHSQTSSIESCVQCSCVRSHCCSAARRARSHRAVGAAGRTTHHFSVH